MKVELHCQYCGYKSEREVFDPKYLKGDRCRKCNDLNLVVRELSAVKIDTYKMDQEKKVETFDSYIGCPAFPPKVEKKQEVKEDYARSDEYPFWFTRD
jgi:hypothetical protein